MKKPTKRPDFPIRSSDNEKRRLLNNPTDTLKQKMIQTVSYEGSSKHKVHPHLFNLPPFLGKRGDASLCDAHAGFKPSDMTTIKILIARGLNAGLIGEGGIWWTIANSGWIFEARVTIPGRATYHGYPVHPSEAIAERVYYRYVSWANAHGTSADRQAAANCKAVYKFK